MLGCVALVVRMHSTRSTEMKLHGRNANHALFVIIYSSEITPTQHLRRLWVRCCNAISATAVVGSAKWKVCEYTKLGSVKRACKKAGATSVKQCTHSISLFFILY